MLNVPAISSYCIDNLPANLDELPTFKILLVFEADIELPRSVIFFVFDIPPISLYSYLYLVFY